MLEKSYLCGINNNMAQEFLFQLSVVICLKSLTFVVSITTRYSCHYFLRGCDLLEKSYLCGINNNQVHSISAVCVVVICLKSLTFVVSITTVEVTYINGLSCDLLEKSYLCGINNNDCLPLPA